MLQKLVITMIALSTTIGIFDPNQTKVNPFNVKDKKQLFETMETITQIPWYYLAAVDQFESNVHQNKDLTEKKRLISIQVPNEWWAGAMNPNPKDTSPEIIQLFQGIGQDGDGDQKASPTNDFDVLYSFSRFLAQQGTDKDAIREQLWKYYQHPTTVDIITHMAEIFRQTNKLDLDEKRFPIPLQYNYTFRNTWGHRRGWGGVRIHEGTDIFASYGTPVLSTCYGYIELIGWNQYGGWRIGIRDTNNNYHYFAHLNGFRKGLKKGMVVKPGDVIGSVGSSGYGPPGTAGKFPPHLHFGIYRFNGKRTDPIDPYATLRKWERETKKRKNKKSVYQKEG